ncbi:methyltransferase domain-containing protein [Asanoa sp. NPDC050611]|uniref:class I SAM-dependent methyltransferase n=1 Tax=Asanoa sp. NPDC050611 TaxID=3157098 RepID=UPI003401F155
MTRYRAALRRTWALRPEDRVLDVGCGAGQSTRDAAGVAAGVLGVDVSAPAVERARASAQDLRNVRFEVADAQTHPFEPGGFDVAISRFGTMFFADPVAAFGNIGRALRPGGRLVMVVWQAADRNEWDVALRRALGVSAADDGPDPFSLADPARLEEILRAAGFADLALEDVHEPVFFGPDTAAALAWVNGFTCTSEACKRLDPAAAARAQERLHETLEARRTDDGIWFDARAWIVTARR